MEEFYVNIRGGEIHNLAIAARDRHTARSYADAHLEEGRVWCTSMGGVLFPNARSRISPKLEDLIDAGEAVGVLQDGGYVGVSIRWVPFVDNSFDPPLTYDVVRISDNKL